MIAGASWTLLPALALAVGYLTWLGHNTLLERRGARVSRRWLERNYRDRTRDR